MTPSNFVPASVALDKVLTRPAALALGRGLTRKIVFFLKASLSIACFATEGAAEEGKTAEGG